MEAAAKNIAIVCNPIAGAGRSIILAQKISEELSKKQIVHSVFKESWPGNFNGFTDVWIVGGDGTLNYFINQYPDIKTPLAIFNGGTGNDVHWLLYANKNFAEQLELVLTTAAKPIDAGRCNEKLFINGVGIGFEGAVAESVAGKKKKPGKTSFLVAVLKKIFSYHSKSYSLRSEEMTKQGKYLMISISNGRRAGGGFHIAPIAKADDGLLDVTLIKAISPVFRLRWLPVIEKGKHLHLSFISHFTTQKIIIESAQMMQTHLDGEICKSRRLEIEILPAQLLFRY
ncbi:MAG TPA: YegS/Rv2252/BmrU family lipid kinase [Chitinophagaceae bacterium]|nr:YegS/Rv2252/BmrU family lipid kinase [Chitinophagaceae bacterium]